MDGFDSEAKAFDERPDGIDSKTKGFDKMPFPARSAPAGLENGQPRMISGQNTL